jgi:hypothetical protein
LYPDFLVVGLMADRSGFVLIEYKALHFTPKARKQKIWPPETYAN